MNLREHVILGGVAATALAPLLGVQESAVFWAASVVIDVDHYWDYVYRNGFRDWSPRRMFEFHQTLFTKIRRPEFLALSLFHTMEWFLLVYLAAVWLDATVLFAALWGMLFHFVLDVVRLAGYRAAFKRAFSMVEYIIRRRSLVRRGLDPDRVYREPPVQLLLAPPARVSAVPAE